MRHWHSAERLPRTSLDGTGGWFLVALLGAYLLMTMQNRVALIGPGVDCWPALAVCAAIAFLVASLAAWRLRPARPYLRPVEATATLVEDLKPQEKGSNSATNTSSAPSTQPGN